MIRVGVVGARGRMGSEVCRAVRADPDLELVAEIVRLKVAGASEPSSFVAALELGPHEMDVAVDFTHPDVVVENTRWLLDQGIHCVVGTTGITPDGLKTIRSIAQAGRANAIVAPNFAIGAVLMQRFAEQAARYFPAAEIVELHREAKADAPSGTALATADRIAGARPAAWRGPGGDEAHPGARGADVQGVRVHAVRLPGLLAHQEVIFGGPGQTLTIRHDSTNRASFMPGVLLAIKAVGTMPGVTIGLDALFDQGG